MEMKYWYAVTIDDDTDHGLGSFDYEEALAIAADRKATCPFSIVKICTIDDDDDYCLEEEVFEFEEEEF